MPRELPPPKGGGFLVPRASNPTLPRRKFLRLPQYTKVSNVQRQMNKRERRAWKADVLNELRRPDDAWLARPTRLGMAGRANRTLTQLRR